MYFLLFYEKVPGYVTRQTPFAAAHRRYFETLATSGPLLLGGSLEDPLDGSAILLFDTDSAEAVTAIAEQDPYVKNGIIAHYHVRRWDTVVGSQLPV